MTHVINVAVCDDSAEMLQQLADYLKQMKELTGIDYRPTFYRSAKDMVSLLSPATDVILLDIGMDEMTGMEAAHLLRNQKNDIPIIFISSMTNYILEGYDVHAFGFLPKPVIFSDLKRLLTEIYEKSLKAKDYVLSLSSEKGTVQLRIQNILYVEVFQHQTSFILDDGVQKFSGISITEAEQQLSSYGFFRCHRSYLINLHHIQKINYSSIIMDNNTEIPLSKHRRTEFLAAYADFVEVSL